MRIATNYILKEHIGPFLFGLAVITFVLIMDFILDILNLIISKGLPTLVILEVFVLNLAWMLALSIPMSVLVAVLMAFGRLSADFEITAFKACGVSYHRLLIPVIIASTLLTIAMMWFNDRVLPEANHRARILMSDITRKKPAWNIEPGVFIDSFPGYHILIQKVAADRVHVEGITIYEQKDRDIPRTIAAKRGIIAFTADQRTLKIDLQDGEIHEPDQDDPGKYRRLKFENQSIYINDTGNELVRSDSEYRGDREQNVSMMRESNKKIMDKIVSAQDNIVGKINQAFEFVNIELRSSKESPNPINLDTASGLQRIIGELKKIDKHVKYEVQNLNAFERQYNSMLVEIHKKFAIPVACIVFTLLGGPLGALSRRGGMGTGLGLSLLFFVLYWAFLIGGEELADRRLISAFWAMWGANTILGAAGIYLLVKTVRETVFIQFRPPDFLAKIIDHFSNRIRLS